MAKPKVRLGSSEDEKYILVICPTCRETRKVKMYWSGGNVVPRIRCNSCKSSVSKRGSGLPVYTQSFTR